MGKGFRFKIRMKGLREGQKKSQTRCVGKHYAAHHMACHVVSMWGAAPPLHVVPSTRGFFFNSLAFRHRFLEIQDCWTFLRRKGLLMVLFHPLIYQSRYHSWIHLKRSVSQTFEIVPYHLFTMRFAQNCLYVHYLFQFNLCLS